MLTVYVFLNKKRMVLRKCLADYHTITNTFEADYMNPHHDQI